MEGSQEGVSELLVHKTVCDGVTAGGDVAEEVDEVHTDWGDESARAVRVQCVPCVHDVDWRPAHEELHHHHEEHSDHPLLGRQALLRVGVADVLVAIGVELSPRGGLVQPPLSSPSSSTSPSAASSTVLTVGQHPVTIATTSLLICVAVVVIPVTRGVPQLSHLCKLKIYNETIRRCADV